MRLYQGLILAGALGISASAYKIVDYHLESISINNPQIRNHDKLGGLLKYLESSFENSDENVLEQIRSIKIACQEERHKLQSAYSKEINRKIEIAESLPFSGLGLVFGTIFFIAGLSKRRRDNAAYD